MNFKNPKYNKHGTIDMEVEHPILGWIPFTASPNDPEDHGRHLYEAAIKSGNVAQYDPEST